MASGNTEDVVFDFEGALSLARSLWSFADEVESAATARGTKAETALASWLGPYATDFLGRASNEQNDLGGAAAALRTDADLWATAWKDATDEQNRRLWARRVDEMKEERNLLEKAGDALTGFDYPPDPTPVPKPTPPMFYGVCTG